jgi:hypothetical protein
MFRNAADTQFVLAAGCLPGICARQWINRAMGCWSWGFTIELDSQLSLWDLYHKAALSGDIAYTREMVFLGLPTVDRPKSNLSRNRTSKPQALVEN